MVVPSPLIPRAPPTPSWSRSEDVRNSLNVLDQVLSEFDDQEPEDEKFLEDQFITTTPSHLNGQDSTAKGREAQLNSKNRRNSDEDYYGSGNVEFRGPTLPTENGRKGGDGQVNSPPPMVDRTKKPKSAPPALPKKVGGLRLGRLSSDDFQSSDSPTDHGNFSNGTSHSSQSSESRTIEEDVADGTVKSTSSIKSHDSIGTSSSGTHDYQEINSDLCEAIHDDYREKKCEEEKSSRRNQQQSQVLQHNDPTQPERLLKQRQQLQQRQHQEEEQRHQEQQHKLFMKHQQHQTRILQENLHNAQRSRGRSMDPKRRSLGGGHESRSSARGRSIGPPHDRRDRSAGRNTNTNRRSRSNERMLESRHSRSNMREQIRENLLLPPEFADQDPRLLEAALRDHRLMMGPGPVHPRLLDPRLGGDPRLIDPHMIDPRLLDPRFDHFDAMGYPIQDSVHFPHLMNYPDHILPPNGMGPILPPGEFASSYPMYSYDMPYLPDPSLLTPEEIHHLQSGGDPSFLAGPPYLDYPQHPYPPHMMQYPMDYPMDYASLGYPMPQDYLPYPGSMDDLMNIPPNHLMMQRMAGDFAPPSPEEAQQTIDRLVRGSRHSLADARVTTDGPTPAQLVKELRRSARHGHRPSPSHHLPPHRTRPLHTDTSKLSSSNYDDVTGGGGRGFRVGDMVRGVGSAGTGTGSGAGGQSLAPGAGGLKGSSASMPHFSPAKDSGFDESPAADDSSPAGTTSLSRDSDTNGGAGCRTIGKTKGGMVVSGVLNNVSNMYIPAPPSPTPDYDDEAEISDGGESDILKGSQFYVVEGEAPDKAAIGNGGVLNGIRKGLKKGMKKDKVAKRKSSEEKEMVSVEEMASTEDSPEGRIADGSSVKRGNSIENGKRNSTASEGSKRDSLSDDSLKDGRNNSRDKDLMATAYADSVPSANNPNVVVSKSCSPLEKMMTKFHESLPPPHAMDDAHFSDDSLEDSMAEDTSTAITSKPSTIDPKNFWNDSIDSMCSANESAASFDYVEANRPPAKNYNAKRMARSNSQTENTTKVTNLSFGKSLSNSNLTAQHPMLNDRGLSKLGESSRVSRRQQVPHRDQMEPIVAGNTSTASSDSAKFDTIKNMLKEGLIHGLDEEPPDFVPPPPFLHFDNGGSVKSRDPNSEEALEMPVSEKRLRSPERPLSAVTYAQEDASFLKSSSRSSLKNVTSKLFSGKDKSESRSKRTESPLSRNNSKNRKSVDKSGYERDRDECDEVEIYAENINDSTRFSTVEDSPPPLPPPRDSSLASTQKAQESSKNSSWLHGPRLPSLKGKKSSGKSSSNEKKSPGLPTSRLVKSQTSRESINSDQGIDVEMMEVSIYTRTVRDGDKVTHVDDFGNEVQGPYLGRRDIDDAVDHKEIEEQQGSLSSSNNEYKTPTGSIENLDDPARDRDFIENLKNLEPHRKRSESQPIISDSSERAHRLSSNGNHSISGAMVENEGISRDSKHDKLSQKKSSQGKSTSSEALNSKVSSKSRSGGTTSPSQESSASSSRPSSQNRNTRASSPMKKKQSPPPPPLNSQTKSPVSPSGRYRSIEDLSPRNDIRDDGGRRLSKESISPPNSTLPSSLSSSESNGLQELRRATSLVVTSGGKKGDSAIRKSPEPTNVGYMPTEEASEAKFRFNIFRGFWKRNKYSFDKA